MIKQLTIFDLELYAKGQKVDLTRLRKDLRTGAAVYLITDREKEAIGDLSGEGNRFDEYIKTVRKVIGDRAGLITAVSIEGNFLTVIRKKD